MEIVYLAQHKQYVDTVSAWVYDEFVVKAGGTMTLDKVIEYFNKTSKDQFPITLVAVVGHKCVGTGSLFENDLKTQDILRPWLASLFVEPSYRNLGIAENLINELLSVANNLGHEKLYLRTEHGSDYYRKRNWSSLGRAIDDKGLETEIFFKLTY